MTGRSVFLHPSTELIGADPSRTTYVRYDVPEGAFDFVGPFSFEVRRRGEGLRSGDRCERPTPYAVFEPDFPPRMMATSEKTNLMATAPKA